jgi:hypothetical protein
LLVAGPGLHPDELGEVRRDLERRPRGRAAVEVRRCLEARPDLLVLDRARARITAGSPLGRVHGWSREPLHVAAAEQLFLSWWEQATPAFVIPAHVIPPFDETDLDVEEWDPGELDAG